MTAITKILVVIDPTASTQPALERVVQLRRPLNAQLTLLLCDYEPNLGLAHELAPAAVAAALESLLARHAKTLNDLAAPLRAQGLDVLIDVRWDYPLHEAIVRKAVEWNADLVVKDTHHHSVLKRSILSNTDWNLIRKCPAKLLLVKHRAIGRVPCIVAAVDPLHPRDKAAALDAQILAAADEMAGLYGAGQTHVLHSFDTWPLVMATTDGLMLGPTTFPLPETIAALRTASTDAVQALTDKHGVPRERVSVLEGRPQDVIVSTAAQLSADLVVMGAVSRSALERVFIGSTAEAVLEKLSCDVLIVKPAA